MSCCMPVGTPPRAAHPPIRCQAHSHAARHVEHLGEGVHAAALALVQRGKHHCRRNHNHGAHDGVEQVAVELPALRGWALAECGLR